MKLTCNISIESIIHVVRIDLLTPHVPSGTAERGQKVNWTDDKRTVSVHDGRSMSSWSYGLKKISRSPWTDFDISDSHTR